MQPILVAYEAQFRSNLQKKNTGPVGAMLHDSVLHNVDTDRPRKGMESKSKSATNACMMQKHCRKTSAQPRFLANRPEKQNKDARFLPIIISSLLSITNI